MTHTAPFRLRTLTLSLEATFTGATYLLKPFTDPEEGWSKDMLVINSPFEDLDAHFKAEDSFYCAAEKSRAISKTLQSVILIFR